MTFKLTDNTLMETYITKLTEMFVIKLLIKMCENVY